MTVPNQDRHAGRPARSGRPRRVGFSNSSIHLTHFSLALHSMSDAAGVDYGVKVSRIDISPNQVRVIWHLCCACHCRGTLAPENSHPTHFAPLLALQCGIDRELRLEIDFTCTRAIAAGVWTITYVVDSSYKRHSLKLGEQGPCGYAVGAHSFVFSVQSHLESLSRQRI